MQVSESDSMLVERSRAGDARAFELLVRRHLRAAHAVALSVMREPADADDICQDAFITALGQLDQLSEPQRFAHWLLRIVRNRALSELRKRKVRMAAPLEKVVGAAGKDDPARNTDRALLRDELQAALATLPQHQREILLLHDLENWKHREIGELLGMPEGTVRNHLFHARRAMRACLQQPSREGDDGE